MFVIIQLVTEKTVVDDSMIGGNASAEGGAEATEDAGQTGVDVVLANRLMETGFAKKKDFQKEVKVNYFLNNF